MGHMTEHEVLINILSSTVLNVVPSISSPIAPSGALREKFGYEIRLPEFEETTRELLRKKGAKVPDLLLINREKRLLITVECKSSFTFQMEEHLSKQIEFYLSMDFSKIWKALFGDIDNIEVWIFAYKKLGHKLADFIKGQSKLKDLTNVIVWGAELIKERELVKITKVHGNHKDGKLNAYLEKNQLECSLPKTDLLIDPTLTYPERVYRIGRRLLAFMASTYISEENRRVTPDAFRNRYADALMTNKELTRCFRYLLTLAPEVGSYKADNQEILLTKRPLFGKIKSKLLAIQSMNEEKFKLELARVSKKRKLGHISYPKLQRKLQKTKLDKWLEKASSMSVYSPNQTKSLTTPSLYNELPAFEDYAMQLTPLP